MWGFARRGLLASFLCCHAAFISASTPGPAHQPCAPRGCSERSTKSAAVESMTSVMSVAMSLMQVPSGIGGSASTIVFATWHRRCGSVINLLRSVSFEVPWYCLSSSGLVRTYVGCGLSCTPDCHPILVPLRGPADINAADESAIRLLCQDIIQTCLSLAAIGALERI